MAFMVSTGHPDYIAVGIEEYGISGEKDGVQGGSRWNLWIGKKNKASDNFLERNGLAPNSGRVYVFVADSGEEDSEQCPCTHEASPHHIRLHASIPGRCLCPSHAPSATVILSSHEVLCSQCACSGCFP